MPLLYTTPAGKSRGRRKILHRNNTAQLRRMYEQDGSLTLELNVSSPKDYMRLACFAIGDC